ncbi:hypothetical protein BDW22DRAFT_1488411 [Trametopsis cervina]|nr:hypothetical protein BDW22DRAFT_1488411 [Trametopsis cervina]
MITPESFAMEASLDISSVSALITGTQDGQLARYFAISGLALTLWDYLLTLEDEAEVVWQRPHLAPKRLVYRLTRFGLTVGLVYFNTVLLFLPKSSMNPVVCKSFAAIIICFIVVSAVGTNTYLVIRHLQSWEGRKVVVRTMQVSLVLTHIPALVLGILAMKQIYGYATYIPSIKTCASIAKPAWLNSAWACVVAFDTFTVILALLNVLDRPRHRDSDIPSYLNADGAPYFLLIFVLRWITLTLLIKIPLAHYFTAIFILWPLTVITLSRFILATELSRRQARQPPSTTSSIGTYGSTIELNRWR